MYMILLRAITFPNHVLIRLFPHPISLAPFFSQLFFCVLFWKRSINPTSISVESGEVYTSVFTSEKQGGLWPACRWSETGSRPGTSRGARTTARAPSRGLDVTHIRFGIPSRRALRDYHVTTETLGRASPPGGGQGWP